MCTGITKARMTAGSFFISSDFKDVPSPKASAQLKDESRNKRSTCKTLQIINTAKVSTVII